MGYATLQEFERLWLGIPIDLDISDWPTIPSTYISIPPAPPPGALDLVAVDVSNGQPPPFDDLVVAINNVLAIEYPIADADGPHTLGQLATPLTAQQCQYIAAQLVWNRIRDPPPTPPVALENIYTTGQDMQNNQDQGPQDQRKWEGSLSAYNSTHDAETLVLAKFIFAASAAVYAENQTALAKSAVLQFPVIPIAPPAPPTTTTQSSPPAPSPTGSSTNPSSTTPSSSSMTPTSAGTTTQTPSSSTTHPSSTTATPPSPPTLNHLSIVLNRVDNLFVVPAAYFYAFGATQAIQITQDTRYTSVLGYSEAKLISAFQAAVDAGILNKLETPITVTNVDPVTLQVDPLTLDQAARRIVAIGASGGNLQTINSSSVATLVGNWLLYSGTTSSIDVNFWTTNVTSTDDYLLLIQTIITRNDPVFINAITAEVKKARGSSASVAVTDLLNPDPMFWTNLFIDFPLALPAWTIPGNTSHRTDAFIQYLQGIIDVHPSQPMPIPVADPNQIPVLQQAGLELDAVTRFLKACPTFKFTSSTLDTSAINAVLDSLFCSNTAMQTKTEKCVETIWTLCQLTAGKDTNADDGSMIISPLQFSYMEALYARGFITATRISLLTEPQFTAALQGTVAYTGASDIHQRAMKMVSSNTDFDEEPSPGFSAVNPGDLVDCIPPSNLSPLSRIQYLHDLLQLSFGTNSLSTIITSRRGAVGNLKATQNNLEFAVPQIDLVNESLEAIGSNLAPPGAVYDTGGIDSEFHGIDRNELLAAIPENSSPANGLKSPSVYQVLKSDMTAPTLPYSQALDVSRTYLDSLGTSRFETMRHFRTDITEFALDPAHESSDFQRVRWRFPLRLDIAIEYLRISSEELTLYTTSLTTSEMSTLFGFTPKEEDWTDRISVVPMFLRRTGLSYSEFIDLWKCHYVEFSPGDGVEYPAHSTCSTSHTRIVFSEKDTAMALYKLAVFIRLWRQLRTRYGNDSISFNLLAKLCNLFQLFQGNNPNPDFIRQLISMFMLRDLLCLKLDNINPDLHPDPLNIWSSTATSAERDAAIELFVDHVERYAKKQYSFVPTSHKKEIIQFLKPLARLVGFTDTHEWNSTPMCTLRFSEVLAKICASKYAVNELLYCFTEEQCLSLFPLSQKPHTWEEPLNVPDDCPQTLWKLRESLLLAEVTEEKVCEWSWELIDHALRTEFGLLFESTSDSFVVFGEHFFPSVMGDHGYSVPKKDTQFRVPLAEKDTTPAMWQGPPYGPFHYHATTGELVAHLPLHDEAVFEQLSKIRQLNEVEQKAVIDLYYAPRRTIVPFALIFSNFSEAAERLIHETSERERFGFFQREFALFYRRCEIIAEHLSSHVTTVSHHLENLAHDSKEHIHTAWEILKHLNADENAGGKWETDSGVPPSNFYWDPHLSGSAFAALLGLTGTGLLGQYKVADVVRWYEVRAPMSAFGGHRDRENVPVPTIVPWMGVKPSLAEQNVVTFNNGFAIGDENCRQLGGAESFQVTWTGVLLIEHHGLYDFTAQQPFQECNDSWNVTLERGDKKWIVLSHNHDQPCESPRLQRGVYDIEIQFKSSPRTFLEDIRPARTGIQVCYCGPDTNDEPCVLPLDKLFIKSKEGPLSLASDNGAGAYLKDRYYSTLRDIRRTYQRAFKALFFTRASQLSSKPTHFCHGQHELGYLLSHGKQFSGTSYYQSSPSVWQSHHVYFNFNFLPIYDPYLSPDISHDERVSPSPQRITALYDWWERCFDYCHLRTFVKMRDSRRLREPLWLLFHEAAEKQTIDILIRHLDVDLSLESLVSKYFNCYAITQEDLEDECWAIRVWNAKQWIEKLQRHFFTRSLQAARFDLWAADESVLLIDSNISPAVSGNQNLTHFVQTSCILDSTLPRIDEIRILNDGLRERARTALISYLCAMKRVTIGDSFATTPQELSSLLLQDVQVGLNKESSRIDDAIASVQTFVQRARLGLEPLATMSSEFSDLWERQFATFDRWESHRRRALYSENWVQWEELQLARKSEAFRFFESQLNCNTLAIPVATPAFTWTTHNKGLSLNILEPVQSTEYSSLQQQNFDEAEGQGLTVVGQPDSAAQLTLVTSVDLPDNPSSSENATVLSAVKNAVPAPSNDNSIPLEKEQFPLWFQAAVRMGTSFIRVAAAGVPPAFSDHHSDPEHAVMDEYYFWVVQGKRFSPEDMDQNADVGMSPSDPSSSSWDPADDTNKSTLETLLHWKARPRYHLFWTRIHLGVFQPPRRSEQGVPLDIDITPLLTFTGRQLDSLNFTLLDTNGFRYDLATDSATVVPQAVSELFPTASITQLPALPYFIYFEPGAPLIPTSPFSTILAVAGKLQAQHRFEDALNWCRIAFDPLQNSNSWTHNAVHRDSVDAKAQSSPISDPVKQNLPSPVGSGRSRAKSVLLLYVEILLQWASSLLEDHSIDALHQAKVLFSEVDRLLGPKPARVLAEERAVGESLTVAEFQPQSAPLNPRLVKLYDRLTTLRGISEHIDSKQNRKPTALSRSQLNLSAEPTDYFLSCGQPYRFTSILPRALELAGLVRSLGSDLLSAYEKGDGEYLDALRTTHERHLLDLGLAARQDEWREADWQVQALQQSMGSALTKSRYYNGLLSTYPIGDETNYISFTQSAANFQIAASTLDATGSIANLIPDEAFGWAGLGPYESTTLPLGTKIGDLFAAAARVVGNQGEEATTNAGLSLTFAEWERRAADWQEQANEVSFEIAEIKRQTLAAERHRAAALRELNNYQQQMEHAAEVQDFMRGKFTKQELYLFLQQETAGLYRQAYELAFQTARKAQHAFCLEHGVIVDLLPDSAWNNFREGLMAGDRLQLALNSMEGKYMDLNCREYEITKHISLRVDLPFAFLQLKTLGWCEFDLPEWIFDRDYPGHYMRRIRNVSLTLPCIVGPYVTVHCCLRLLSSTIRLDPSLCGLTTCSCQGPRQPKDVEDHSIRLFTATEAIATSGGQNDAGLFELNFRDERYLPFEFSGAVSRWKIELPAENNQFDLNTLTDMVMHLNYTSRDGGPELRRLASERSRGRLPGDGMRLFDVRQEFPDIFATLLQSERPDSHNKRQHIDLPLRFNRNLFPFLTGRRAVTIIRMEIFIEPFEHVDIGQHIDIQIVPNPKHQNLKQNIECIVSSRMPQFYEGSFQGHLGPINDQPVWHEFGHLRLPKSMGHICQIYLLCHYVVDTRKANTT